MGYSGRYIVSVIALSSRGAVALYTGESVFFLYLRVLGLTFPRVLSGSVLYIILAEYINSPLLSIISKLRILGGMAAVTLRGGIISRKGPVAAGKYFSFMWGLAAAVGASTEGGCLGRGGFNKRIKFFCMGLFSIFVSRTC